MIPGCDCGPHANFEPGMGCIESDECRDNTGTCTTEDGATYRDGDVWPKGDGCNNCICLEGQIACTEAACVP